MEKTKVDRFLSSTQHNSARLVVCVLNDQNLKEFPVHLLEPAKSHIFAPKFSALQLCPVHPVLCDDSASEAMHYGSNSS